MNAPTFDRRLIGLAIIPVAIYILVYAVIDRARPSGIVFTTLDIPPFPDVGVAVAEAKLRYFWLSALVLLTAVSLAVAASSAFSLLRDAPRRDRVLMFGLVAMAWVAIAVLEQSSLTDHWYVHMGDGLFEGIFSRVSAGSITALQALNIGLDVSKLATAAALLLLVAGFLTTLTQAPANATKQQQADHLAGAIARQRTLLQHAALLYVFAILPVLSWMYWPLPFMANTAMEAAYRELLVGAAILHGVAFSLGVAAIYLPPALVLRSRVVRSEHLVNEGEAGKAIQATIGSHPFDQVRQIAVMVSPALVSMLPVLKDIFEVT
jgi:hypothetical protein